MHQILVAERTLLSTDPTAPLFSSMLEEHEGNIRQIKERMASFAELAATREEVQLYENFLRLEKEWEAVTRQVVEEVMVGAPENLARARALSNNEGVRLFHAMRQPVDQLYEQHVHWAEKAHEKGKTTYENIKMRLAGSTALAVAVGALLSFLIGIGISRPLQRCLAFAQNVANGNFKQDFAVNSSDEVGQVCSALKDIPEKIIAMRDELRRHVHSVEQGELADRADATSFQGGFAELVEGANAMADMYIEHLDNMNVPFATMNREMRILYANKPARSLAGVELEQARRMHCRELFRLDDHDSDESACKQAILRENPVFAETVAHPAGKRMDIQYASVPLKDRVGNVVGLMVVITDLTELKDIQRQLTNTAARAETMAEREVQRTRELESKTRELEVANEHLKNVDELKSHLMSSVSHDIRTPLTSILGYAKLSDRIFDKHFEKMAQSDPAMAKAGAKLHENLHIILEEGERLSRLVNDFLDLSKIESGKMEWRDRVVKPADMAKTAMRVLEVEFDKRNDLIVSSDTPNDVPNIFVDPDRVVQVLVNLLHNAVKFTAAGTVRLKASSNDGYVHFSVEDTGVGLSSEEVERVFDTFYQANLGERTAMVKGSGLGLSICKRIVDHYGGDINVTSQKDIGTVFTVSFPELGAQSHPQ